MKKKKKRKSKLEQHSTEFQSDAVFVMLSPWYIQKRKAVSRKQ